MSQKRGGGLTSHTGGGGKRPKAGGSTLEGTNRNGVRISHRGGVAQPKGSPTGGGGEGGGTSHPAAERATPMGFSPHAPNPLRHGEGGRRGGGGGC